MTDPDNIDSATPDPERPNLAERLSRLDLEKPEDLNALFQMQEELGTLAGIDVEPPLSAADLPSVEPEAPPSDAYLAAADPAVSLQQFIEIASPDTHNVINTQTLLFPACITGSLAKVTWLTGQGLDPNHKDKNGYTPLVYATLPGTASNLDLIKFLIAKGADVNAASSHNESPLRLSIRTGNYVAVRLLIAAGADAEKAAFSPLHQAAAAGNLDSIARLATPRTIEEQNTWKRTPWLTAIHADQVDAAHLLKSCGANVSAVGHLGSTALHLAAESNAPNSIRYLLSSGFDIESLNEFQATPLHEAAENDALDAAELLIHAGVNVHALTHTQDAPIHRAYSKEMLKLLHNAGANLNQISGEGRWPLWNAAQDGDTACVRWLLDNGADINASSSSGIALHAAAAHDNLEIVQILLDAGSDPNTQDCDGDTPLLPTTLTS